MSRVDTAWGSNDLDTLFPDGAPATTTPFERAGRLKNKGDYDREAVKKALRNPKMADVDPREVRSTQPGITRAGVQHYLSGAEGLFADQGNAGNANPVVYRREDGQNLLLSGHHRAAAALLQGRQFRANVVSGPWGPAR